MWPLSRGVCLCANARRWSLLVARLVPKHGLDTNYTENGYELLAHGRDPRYPVPAARHTEVDASQNKDISVLVLVVLVLPSILNAMREQGTPAALARCNVVCSYSFGAHFVHRVHVHVHTMGSKFGSNRRRPTSENVHNRR